jgi:hypothetical protein
MTEDVALDDQVPLLGEEWCDALESGVRREICLFIEELPEAELEAAVGRCRYHRGQGSAG